MYSKAMEYAVHGMSIIPVLPNKRPWVDSWTEYQNRVPTDKEIEEWWETRPEAGIAIVTGKISGISVVDVDVHKGGDPSPFPETKTVETPNGGLHLYYEYSPDAHTSTNADTHIDIRSDGGYVLAPPSTVERKDKTMGTYKIVKDIPMAPFPSHLFPKQEQKRDWKTIEAGTSEGSRNSNMAAFFGRMMQKFPAEEWESLVWPIGQLVDSRNNPPLGDTELRTVFESIARKEKSKAPYPDDESEINYEGETLAELYKVKFPDLEWLADHLIPLGGLTAVTGAPKSFKTFFLQDLAVSVATGKPFLGKFPVATGRILFVDEENPRRTTVKRFKGMGMSSSENIVILARKGVHMDKPKSVEALLRYVDKLQPRLIIIDSLTKVHSKNENASNEMSDVFTEIKKFMREDRAVVIIHHHNKASRNDKRGEGSSIRGSSNIYAEVDAHLAIDRRGVDRNNIVVTQGALRDAEEMKPFSASLVMDENGAVRFGYQGELNEKEAVLTNAINAVRELFTSTDTRLRVDECAEWSGIAAKIVRDALKRLEDDKVLTHDVGKHNKFTYRLIPVAEIQNGGAEPEK